MNCMQLVGALASSFSMHLEIAHQNCLYIRKLPFKGAKNSVNYHLSLISKKRG